MRRWLVVLVGCSLLAAGCVGENNPVHAEVRFTNKTGVPIIPYEVPTRLTLGEWLSDYSPRQITRDDGESWANSWGFEDPVVRERPACQAGVTYWFVQHVDPDFRLGASADDPQPVFEDLIVIEKLVDPCWEDDRAEYTIKGDS